MAKSLTKCFARTIGILTWSGEIPMPSFLNKSSLSCFSRCHGVARALFWGVMRMVNQDFNQTDLWWLASSTLQLFAFNGSLPAAAWVAGRCSIGRPSCCWGQKGSQTCAYWTLAVLKIKSDFHTENKKSCLGFKLNFVFYTCLPHFTFGLTILDDIRKVRQVYVVISVKC